MQLLVQMYVGGGQLDIVGGGMGGGGTPLYDLYEDVPLDRGFRSLCPKQGIYFRASLS